MLWAKEFFVYLDPKNFVELDVSFCLQVKFRKTILSQSTTTHTPSDMMDLELKKAPADVSTATQADIDAVESQSFGKYKSWISKAAAWGVEIRGTSPVPLEERIDPRFINVFFVWFTMSTNLLPYVSCLS